MRNLYVDYSYYSEDDEENIKREEEIIDLGYFQDWINDTGRDVWGYDINDLDDVKLEEVLDEYIVEYLASQFICRFPRFLKKMRLGGLYGV